MDVEQRGNVDLLAEVCCEGLKELLLHVLQGEVHEIVSCGTLGVKTSKLGIVDDSWSPCFEGTKEKYYSPRGKEKIALQLGDDLSCGCVEENIEELLDIVWCDGRWL